MFHEKPEDQGPCEYVIASLTYVQGLSHYDMDDPASVAVPFDARNLSLVEAIKCDGEYFKVPEGSTDLAEVVLNRENLLSETDVLGTEGMLAKYLNELDQEIVEVG